MGYMRSADGVSPGFDLDETEYAVCGVQDLEGPDGEPGIDNGLSYLIPALEASEAKVVEGYINTGILEGRILLVVSVSKVDSLRTTAVWMSPSILPKATLCWEQMEGSCQVKRSCNSGRQQTA